MCMCVLEYTDKFSNVRADNASNYYEVKLKSYTPSLDSKLTLSGNNVFAYTFAFCNDVAAYIPSLIIIRYDTVIKIFLSPRQTCT